MWRNSSIPQWRHRYCLNLVFRLVALGVYWAGFPLHAEQIDIVDADGYAFGTKVTSLPNGNFVVLDDGGVGAVHLYTPQGVRISSLRGQAAGDLNSAQIIVLRSGDFVVTAPSWSNGPNANAGAVTWISSSSGLSASISAANSLTGSNAGDRVGISVKVLANGNYVVLSPFWTRDVGGGVLATKVGAVTWARGDLGIAGRVSETNSLVGSSQDDGEYLGLDPITELDNGNFIVRNPGWNNGAVVDAGAVTWVNGSTGLVGAVSAGNSLVGSHANDRIGNAATLLRDGNYVVQSLGWNNGNVAQVGAVTWCNGASATVATVSAANSLVGAAAGDVIGELVAPATSA